MPAGGPSPFRELFGVAPATRAEAPGRVNLMGEHTDYNGGFVVPTAIPLRTAVELAPRGDRQVRVASDGSDAGAPRGYVLGAEAPTGSWIDYVQGCTHVLGVAGQTVSGFDARITSDVPIGRGLASSAALTVALLRALRAAFDLALDDVALTLAAHRAEYDFVGARVGVMDQMAASLADERHALFLDARSLAYERFALPPGATLLVLDSGVAHAHASGDYNTRRSECEAAAARLGVAQLRDVTDPGALAPLPPPLDRRARHVVTENARVLAAAAALRAGDVAALGRLMVASHASQRDDFAVSTPDVDLLVALACAEPGVHGARLTGGGFGGAVIALAEPGRARAAAGRVVAGCRRRTGRGGAVLVA